MNLDTLDLFKNEGYTMEINGQTDFSAVEYYGDHPFKICAVTGKAQNKGGIVTLKLEADLQVETQCARCLKLLSLRRHFQVKETLVKESKETDEASESYTVVKGRSLDLDEVILSAVLLDIDMVFLCCEDCKGLCPVCGTNLNEGMCDCGKDDHD